MIQNIKEIELKKRIASEDINFIAFPVTPWAAHGVEAFICGKKEESIDLKGYVCIVKHGRAGYLVDETHFSFENKNIRIVRIIKSEEESFLQKCIEKFRMWKYLCEKQKRGRKIYVLNQGCPNYEWHSLVKEIKPNHQVCSVVIDEGIGMYMREKKEWLNENMLMATGLKNKCSAFFMIMVKQPLMKKIIETHGEVERFCLFDKQQGRLQEDKRTIALYKKAICHNSQIIPNEQKKLYDKALVINTQPFFEYGQVLKDEDLKWIETVCSICKKYGVKVVLKPHPRERKTERYIKIDNCIIDNNNGISQESIMSQLDRKPYLIIGFSSTTLVTEKLFEGIEGISLIKCIDGDNFAKSILGDFRGFEKTFSDKVIFPENIEELSRIIINAVAQKPEGEK